MFFEYFKKERGRQGQNNNFFLFLPANVDLFFFFLAPPSFSGAGATKLLTNIELLLAINSSNAGSNLSLFFAMKLAHV